MKILLYDENYGDDNIRYMQPLEKNLQELDIRFHDTLDSAKEEFSNNIFDYLIIDFTTTYGKVFLDFIMLKKPQQKIITLGYELTSSDSNCDNCIKNFQKRRLIKPISPVDIYNTIINFDKEGCKYAHHFSNMPLLVEDMVSRHHNYTYNKEISRIEPIEESNVFCLRDFLELIDELKKYKINYTIIDEYTIELT